MKEFGLECGSGIRVRLCGKSRKVIQNKLKRVYLATFAGANGTAMGIPEVPTCWLIIYILVSLNVNTAILYSKKLAFRLNRRAS